MPNPTHAAIDGAFHKCRRCGDIKPARCFAPSAFRRRVPMCRECIRLDMRVRYDANKAKADAIKLGRGCADCGYRTAATALEFDHLPGTAKVREVSHLYGNCAWTAVAAEIAKCEVVCANCHKIRSDKRGAGRAYWVKWRAEQEAGAVALDGPGELPLLLPPRHGHGRPAPVKD